MPAPILSFVGNGKGSAENHDAIRLEVMSSECPNIRTIVLPETESPSNVKIAYCH